MPNDGKLYCLDCKKELDQPNEGAYRCMDCKE